MKFDHAAHVESAWTCVRAYPLLEALAHFRDSIQRFAREAGKPALYHETVTWAYLLLIHERMQRASPDQDFPAFQSSNLDLFLWKPGILEAYYRPETLASDFARECFVLPDRGIRIHTPVE